MSLNRPTTWSFGTKSLAEIESTHWSIVLIGSFNPAIFHPSWFELHGVIPKEVAKVAKLEVVHNQLSKLSLGDLTVTAEVAKFQVETTNAPEIRLLDFVSKVFGDVLPHSKISSFGINKTAHFRTVSPERRLAMGRCLAPLAPWGQFGERIGSSEGENLGGMISLRMREILSDDESFGHLEARVEPSNILDERTGVLVSINRHFEIKDQRELSGSVQGLSILDREFDPALKAADEIISHFLEKAN